MHYNIYWYTIFEKISSHTFDIKCFFIPVSSLLKMTSPQNCSNPIALHCSKDWTCMWVQHCHLHSCYWEHPSQVSVHLSRSLKIIPVLGSTIYFIIFWGSVLLAEKYILAHNYRCKIAKCYGFCSSFLFGLIFFFFFFLGKRFLN